MEILIWFIYLNSKSLKYFNEIFFNSFETQYIFGSFFLNFFHNDEEPSSCLFLMDLTHYGDTKL